jgi:hypothetical protein
MAPQQHEVDARRQRHDAGHGHAVETGCLERCLEDERARHERGRDEGVLDDRIDEQPLSRDAACILVIDGGEIRETGTHEELLRRPGGVYRRLYELHFREEDPAL